LHLTSSNRLDRLHGGPAILWDAGTTAACPGRSIPIEGPATIPGAGTPDNPVVPDEISLARGAQLFQTHCLMCHGEDGKGMESCRRFSSQEARDLSSALSRARRMARSSSQSATAWIDAALNENLNVRERWDVVNYIRTFKVIQ